MTRLLNVRQMTRLDVQLALDWAAAEGWNPGWHDATAFYASDPSGFFIAEVDGEPIGCISTVCYDVTFGFIGLYIVKPEWRKQGYGLRLWQTAWQQLVTRLDPLRGCVGLDAVIERESTYRKAGFVSAYQHIRHVYQPASSTAVPKHAIELTKLPLEEIVRYDAELFPVKRPQFLAPWIRVEGGAAYGILEQEHLVGYGVLRPCRQGFKIGPLFANNLESAQELFQALTYHAGSQPVFIDIPDINPAIHIFRQHYGLEPVFACQRMYWGNVPSVDVNRIFAVTTLELG